MMVLWILRFFVFQLYESPKYLMGRGRDDEAVEVIHEVAAYNGKTSNLTVERLKQAEKLGSGSSEEEVKMDVSAAAAVKRKLAKFDGSHVKPLFATRKMAYSTSILIVLWGKSISRCGCELNDRRMDYSVHRSCISIVSAFIVKRLPDIHFRFRYNGFVTY
jgi:hypothetical protein